MTTLYTITDIAKNLQFNRITVSKYILFFPNIFTKKVRKNKVLYSINSDYDFTKINELFKEKSEENFKNRKTRWTV